MSDHPHGGHPKFYEILDEMAQLHSLKSYDYGDRGEDPLANIRASSELGIEPFHGALLRFGDKWHRIKMFLKHGTLENESVRDDLRDGAAYLLIAAILLDEKNAESLLPKEMPLSDRGIQWK
jgi:hypothetical protein